MTKQNQLSPLFAWRKAITQSTLKATTRHVLLTLSLHMNAEGKSCFPSVRTVAGEAGLSRRAVGVHLTLAVNEGWIVRRIRGSQGYNWHAYEYELAFPTTHATDAEVVAETTSTPGSHHVPPWHIVVSACDNDVSPRNTDGNLTTSDAHDVLPRGEPDATQTCTSTHTGVNETPTRTLERSS
jgi:hypothetical protein